MPGCPSSDGKTNGKDAFRDGTWQRNTQRRHQPPGEAARASGVRHKLYEGYPGVRHFSPTFSQMHQGPRGGGTIASSRAKSKEGERHPITHPHITPNKFQDKLTIMNSSDIFLALTDCRSTDETRRLHLF